MIPLTYSYFIMVGFCEIWGPQGSDSEDFFLAGCDAICHLLVDTKKQENTAVPPRLWYPSTKRHSVTFQKTVTFKDVCIVP